MIESTYGSAKTAAEILMARDVKSLLRQQTALAAFGAYAFQESDLDSILTEAARVCAGSMGVPYCKICYFREKENDLLIRAGFGWGADVVGRVVSKADNSSPQGRAFTSGKAIIIRNLRQDNDLRLAPFYREYDIISTVDVIIKTSGGQPFGVLEIDSVKEHEYDQHDIDFLNGFANVLAEAVATNNRNLMLQETIVHMQLMILEKERLLEERDILAKELQHRVRNNLFLVYGMLGAHLRRANEGADQDGLRAIMRRIMVLADVYDQLLGVGLTENLDFGSYMKMLCSHLPDLQGIPVHPIELICSVEELLLDLPTVTALGIVVAELVANAYEHAFTLKGGTIEARLACDGRPDRGIIVIHDDGVGFVYPTETNRNGIGLARRIMETLQGTLDVTGGQGTTWTLRFPAALTKEPAC